MNVRIKRYFRRGIGILLGLVFISQLYILIRIYWITSCVIPTPSMSPTLLEGDYIVTDMQIPGRRILKNSEDGKGKIIVCRKKGGRDIRKGDVVVFNFPYAEREDKMVLSMKRFYCKRCVAVPGEKYGFTKDGLKDTFYIPGKGDQLKITEKNYMHYYKCIEYETGKSIIMKNGLVYCGDSVIDQYRFCSNYYFMCGDNVENSYDSRYWGMLPEDFILGVGRFIWLSKDKKTGKIRWNRIFTKI